MNSDDSVTQWIQGLKAGDELAAERLWKRYFQRLVGFARVKMTKSDKRLEAEEDVALSAFKSLCLGAENGRFPQLVDRDNLWPLLAVLTSRKASYQVRQERRLKRGGGKVFGASDLDTNDGTPGQFDNIFSHEPTPDFAAAMSEQCERLLGLLDEKGREIALAKMEGYSNEEIALRTGISLRSVERKLSLVRQIWEKACPEED